MLAREAKLPTLIVPVVPVWIMYAGSIRNPRYPLGRVPLGDAGAAPFLGLSLGLDFVWIIIDGWMVDFVFGSRVFSSVINHNLLEDGPSLI